MSWDAGRDVRSWDAQRKILVECGIAYSSMDITILTYLFASIKAGPNKTLELLKIVSEHPSEQNSIKFHMTIADIRDAFLDGKIISYMEQRQWKV
jgi:hypothetical protein